MNYHHRPFGYGLCVAAVVLFSGCTQPTVESTAQPTTSPSATQDATAQLPANTAPSQADPLSDTVIIPGDRVGPVTQTTSRQALADLFGEDKLRDETISVGEGFFEPGTVVDLGPADSFTVIWTDDSKTMVSAVKNFGTAWKTPEDIGIGSTLEELRSRLGDFQLYGFGWDYGGTINLEGTALDNYKDVLVLRVQPTVAVGDTPEAYRGVIGEKLFAADDANVQALNPVVEQMIVYLTPRSQSGS